MRDKVKGTILAAAGGVGTVWLLLNFTPIVPWWVLEVICATICVDGVATVVGEIKTDRAIKKAREKYKYDALHFLDLYK
ncbi:MAG: hypothetical protein LIO86_14840 [Lachnospiraceae bacterium]|nr:hypothetical protein [Lachnospiraceae bacterium]